MGGAKKLINNMTGGLFGRGGDSSAANQQMLALQMQNEAKAAEEARKAQAEKAAAEEAQKKKRANVAASGRKSTILAGENEDGKSLLGS